MIVGSRNLHMLGTSKPSHAITTIPPAFILDNSGIRDQVGRDGIGCKIGYHGRIAIAYLTAVCSKRFGMRCREFELEAET